VQRRVANLAVWRFVVLAPRLTAMTVVVKTPCTRYLPIMKREV